MRSEKARTMTMSLSSSSSASNENVPVAERGVPGGPSGGDSAARARARFSREAASSAG